MAAMIRRQPRWKVIGGLGAAGILAAVAALQFLEPTLDENTQREVDYRLGIAKRQISSGQLIAPEGFNAAETYRGIMEIAPGYEKALDGLSQIADTFESGARTKYKAGKPQEGLRLVIQGLGVDPEHKGLLGLRDDITHQLKTETERHLIAALLKKADHQFEAWRLVEPADDNAWQSYRAVLDRDPKNKQALQGLESITGRLERLAHTKRSGGNFVGALEDVENGLRVNPQHTGLLALKARLAIEKRLAEAKQQLRADQLVTPAGENAFETYQSILYEQPEADLAEQARAGLRAVAARLTALAKSDWDAGRPAESLERLSTGTRLFKGLPGYDELQALQNTIEHEQRITGLLAKAAQQLENGQIFEPDGDNALASYHEVQTLDPNNPQAHAGLRTIADRQLQAAERARADENFAQALAAVNQGLAADPDHQDLASLKIQIEEAIEQREARKRLLARHLHRAEEHLAAGRFTLPAGNNAYQSYQEMLGIEPDNETAQRGIQELVRTIEERAQEKRQAGALQESLALVEEGLKVKSSDQALRSLRQALLDQMRAMEVKQRVAMLLDRAEAQLKADKLTSPPGDNADESYREVLTSDPKNEQAKAGRRRILERFAELAQERRLTGDFETSLGFIAQGLKVDPEDAPLLALQSDVEQRIAVRRKIETLLTQAEQQLRAMHLKEPPGDNAYDSYQEVLELEPHNESALSGLNRIAERYLQLAQRKQQQGDLQTADGLVQKGLSVVPDNPLLLTLQDEIQQQLAAERVNKEQIATLLHRAKQQLSEDRLKTPENDNAYDTYQNVLALDPNNQAAQDGIQKIVARIAELAELQQSNGKLRESLALVEQGLEIDKENSTLLSLREALQQELAKEEHAREAEQLLVRAEMQLESGKLLELSGDNAYETLQQVLERVPGNERALIGLHRIAEHQSQLASQAYAEGNLDEAGRLVAQGLEVAPWHPGLLGLQQKIGRGGPPPETDPMGTLLAKADQQIANSKLTRPAGDNAYETLQAVLASDPDNTDAKTKLSSIAGRYAGWARTRLRADNRPEALEMANRGLEVDPQHAELLALKAELTKLAPPPDPAATKLASLLAEAEQQLAAGRTTKPVGDNAYETLKAVLKLQPGNREAQAGLRTLAAQHEVAIKSHIKKGKLQEGLTLIDEGLRFFPEHTALAAMQDDLAKLQTQQNIKSLFAKAERQLGTSQWTQPPGNNAFETLQMILRLDPNNNEAQQQLTAIPKNCEERARMTLQNGDRTGALAEVEECLMFFPKNSGLTALKNELNHPRI